MKKSTLLIIATSILFACATKKEPVATEPAPQAENEKTMYEKIMAEIKSGLTGNARENRVYLYKQVERYEEHEQAEEIKQGIVEIVFEEFLKSFEMAKSQNFAQFDSAVKNAKDQWRQGNPHKSLEIIQPEAEEIELIREFVYKDDSVNIYRVFNNIVEEEIYWKMIHGDSKSTVRLLPKNFVSLYLTYGTNLVELKLYDKAKAALLKALEMNPVYTDILFELGVTIQKEKDWKVFFQLTQAAHKFSYTKEDIARCYRNYGYYFIEQGNFDDAIAMYYASLSFDSTQIKIVLNELDYIQHTTKNMIPKLDKKQISSVFEKNSIKFGADDNLLNIIQSLGRALEDEKRYDEAKYCYKVLYELTNDKKFKELMETPRPSK
jgi:tetratricopeptide (TPR) repeat protein